MSEPTPLELLHADYAQLELRNRATLTADQVRSLIFYNAERTAAGAAAATNPGRDVIAWTRNTEALSNFVARESRMPRENRRLSAGAVSAEEMTLVNRVRNQRRAFKADRLCTYQKCRLECIPGFSFNPLEDAWHAIYNAYIQFTRTHREAPKLRSAPAESALAGWAAKNRMAYHRGKLSQRRTALLNEVEFWSWGASKTRTVTEARDLDHR
ncbi:helicase associated domain-containing protein [Cryobacterium sp. 10S3]|uniref:helicase associated domain-containing protein n=1 Tax=unclassified Cryobacterium TaxID=2649013 RepID=UPI002AC914F1|nr:MULTISPECIES: helicase associated domain-containing protein [unclassified Cryobacterium]MEB0001665.1 helicase associated domain-containing protein [Cryobacterium sp. RTC2.1]MEB0286696.1 helicase associated domain-containing protein [Cryobacterium sp. 10S3]WPX13183.1 helicase associated domain-containing protein [Cryobacterium sp. 10S3]